jgi:predicted ATPase
MLTRVRIDNFRCFQNLEVELRELSLLMGDNGSGKSSFLEAIARLQRLIAGRVSATEAFPGTDVGAWDVTYPMSFGLEFRLADPVAPTGDALVAVYELLIQYDEAGSHARVLRECVRTEEGNLFEFVDGNVRLHRDDYSEGPTFPMDASGSALALVTEGQDSRRLTAVRHFVRHLQALSLEPRQIRSEATDEESRLRPDGTNFAAWYGHMMHLYPEGTAGLNSRLQEVLPGYQTLFLEPVGARAKVLKARFDPWSRGGYAGAYLFSELSDGQRALVVLYTLLVGVPPMRHALLIDEPDNYLALREIQPWLLELSDACGVTVPQAILVSHHPEVVNYLARAHGILFTRDANGPTRVRYGLADDGTGLEPAELMARGWLDE